MNDDETRAAAEACQDILTKVAETLRAARRLRPALTVEQGERAALQVALDDLVSLYICDPASIGGKEGAAWILNRILTELDTLGERDDPILPTPH
ncbi:hypothetical protein [Methylobacterium oryzisoli]|uniref:hypothetical protein n=1 Tax=Methylobacterium oryzisoli TaxID=3385502 RepID=UPI00389156EB